MKILPQELEGLYLIEFEKINDSRGFFARTFCEDEFKKLNLEVKYVQESTAYNKTRGTIRGLHFQTSPHEETKLVRCTKGSIFEVVVDIRKNSKTYSQYQVFELKATDYKMLYIPKGFAHGYQTLENDTEMLYKMSTRFQAEYNTGVHYKSKGLNIAWPIDDVIISEKDKNFKEFV